MKEIEKNLIKFSAVFLLIVILCLTFVLSFLFLLLLILIEGEVTLDVAVTSYFLSIFLGWVVGLATAKKFIYLMEL